MIISIYQIKKENVFHYVKMVVAISSNTQKNEHDILKISEISTIIKKLN
ncbi:hypothetical protein JSQ73_004960 [Wolbachia endosymbiont of Anopheles demeilloni]|nr:hypothetical protein [Wolbachia endosymbiont of Anopheles demeilloni]UIP92514.1 hypothetical protein JSQ73_004960 [Wolbachia endosymbiont of Anopheles demeilloni]